MNRPHFVLKTHEGESDMFWTDTGWTWNRAKALPLGFFEAVALVCNERLDPANKFDGFSIVPVN